MSADDDLPEYLRGVAGPPDEEAKPRTIGARVDDEDEDEDDDYVEDRPPLISPLLVVIVLVALSFIAISTLGSIMIGGSSVSSAEEAAILESGEMSRVVAEEGKIIDSIGSLGGDRAKLEGLLDAAASKEGLAKGIASLQFARAVEAEIVNLGDIRGTPVADQQAKLVVVSRSFDQSLAEWRSASRGILGSAAVTIGMANPAPPAP